MKLIVGLGNVGNVYENTRHNLGFMCVDYFARKHNLVFKEDKKLKCLITTFNYNSEKIIIIKPTTYMNLSGEAVLAVKNFYKISILDILIICDDLDSHVGRVRLRQNGSSGGHNGLKNIILHLGTEEFKRVKIGIGRDPLINTADYVLGHFKTEDKVIVDEAIVDVCAILEEFIEDEPFYKIASKYSKKWVYTHFLVR